MAFYALRKVFDTPFNVTTTSQVVLAANEARKYAILINTSNENMWLRLGNPAVVGEGIFLARAGFAYEISQDNLYVGAIHAIHDGTGDKKLSILELS